MTAARMTGAMAKANLPPKRFGAVEIAGMHPRPLAARLRPFACRSWGLARVVAITALFLPGCGADPLADGTRPPDAPTPPRQAALARPVPTATRPPPTPEPLPDRVVRRVSADPTSYCVGHGATPLVRDLCLEFIETEDDGRVGVNHRMAIRTQDNKVGTWISEA